MTSGTSSAALSPALGHVNRPEAPASLPSCLGFIGQLRFGFLPGVESVLWQGKLKINATRNAVLLAAFSLSCKLRQTAFPGQESNGGMNSFCTIEYGSGNMEGRCGRTAIATCDHCGALVCSLCAKQCCALALCGYCYDYHVVHSCLKGSPPTEFCPVPIAFCPVPHYTV